MPFDVAAGTIEYFLRRRDLFSEEHARFSFAGGEPLLEPALLERIASYLLRRLAEERHPWLAGCRFELTTNGLNLRDPGALAFLRRHRERLDVTLSLDGTREAHDTNRVHADGSGSWASVMEGYSLWRELFPVGRVRTTVDPANVRHLAETVRFLWSLGIQNPNLVLVQEDVWEPEDGDAIAEQLDSITEAIAERGFPTGLGCSLLSPEMFGALDDRQNAWCGAGSSMLLVDRRGVFYPCTRFIPESMQGREPRSIGNFRDGLDQNRLRPFFSQARRLRNPPGCEGCVDAAGCAWCLGEDVDRAASDTIWDRSVHTCGVHRAIAAAARRFVRLRDDAAKSTEPGTAVGADIFTTEMLVAQERHRSLHISAVCNARCFYCSNKWNPFAIQRPGHRSLESVRRALAFFDDSSTEELHLNDSLPGRIAEGEAFTHPQLFEILDLVRSRLPSRPLQVTTNGILLTDALIQQLSRYLPMRISISYHSDDPILWSRAFKVDPALHAIARAAFAALKEAGFRVKGAITPMAALGGYEDLERTIRFMARWVDAIHGMAPGYSDRATEEERRLLAVDYPEMSRFFQRMHRELRIPVELDPDVLSPLLFTPEPILRAAAEEGYRNVLWLFSEAAYGRAISILERGAAGVPGSHRAFLVKNRSYGGNIISAGCLLVGDFRAALEEALAARSGGEGPVDLVLMPARSFDRTCRDLSGRSSREVTAGTGLPHWVAWHDGRIFARIEAENRNE
jgi:uncharacterized protein